MPAGRLLQVSRTGAAGHTCCCLPSVAYPRHPPRSRHHKFVTTLHHTTHPSPPPPPLQAATIRSNYPLPADVPLFYFEVTVLDRGQVGRGKTCMERGF